MNRKNWIGSATLLAGVGLAFGAATAGAETIEAKMVGFNEVPSVSTTGRALFRARIDARAEVIYWELDYDGLQADATQSHIHFGQRHTNGGITVWLCSNLNPPGNTPPGTQACPLRSGHISGTIAAANVLLPAATQQLPAGGFNELVKAIRAGATYANVHTAASPGGEIRGQLRGRDKGHDDHDHGHGG